MRGLRKVPEWTIKTGGLMPVSRLKAIHRKSKDQRVPSGAGRHLMADLSGVASIGDGDE
jgi:hypothetical protein